MAISGIEATAFLLGLCGKLTDERDKEYCALLLEYIFEDAPKWSPEVQQYKASVAVDPFLLHCNNINMVQVAKEEALKQLMWELDKNGCIRYANRDYGSGPFPFDGVSTLEASICVERGTISTNVYLEYFRTGMRKHRDLLGRKNNNGR